MDYSCFVFFKKRHKIKLIVLNQLQRIWNLANPTSPKCKTDVIDKPRLSWFIEFGDPEIESHLRSFRLWKWGRYFSSRSMPWSFNELLTKLKSQGGSTLEKKGLWLVKDWKVHKVLFEVFELETQNCVLKQQIIYSQTSHVELDSDPLGPLSYSQYFSPEKLGQVFCVLLLQDFFLRKKILSCVLTPTWYNCIRPCTYLPVPGAPAAQLMKSHGT